MAQSMRGGCKSRDSAWRCVRTGWGPDSERERPVSGVVRFLYRLATFRSQLRRRRPPVYST